MVKSERCFDLVEAQARSRDGTLHDEGKTWRDDALSGV